MSVMSCEGRFEFLETVVSLRAGLLAARQSQLIEERISGLCDSLSAWARLPLAASHFYGRIILDGLFELAECFEDDPRLGEMQRLAIELSIWQATSKLGLDELDHSRSAYLTTRRRRLQQALESNQG